MRNAKTRTILTHAAAWFALVAYHIVTSLFLDSPFWVSAVRLISYHLFVYIPMFYFVYFLALKPFGRRYKSIVLLAIFILACFAIYTEWMFLFTKYVYTIFVHKNYSKLVLDWAFVLDSIDLFFLSNLLYALLYWYAQRNIEAQKVLREKEAKEFQTAQQLHELEGMALRAQMNPHFIFNSLNSVQFFIVDKDMETANRYLGRFGHLIRQTLDNSAESMISLEREKQYLDTYLELEKMRRPDAFDYEIKIDEQLDASGLFLPTMLLQPYVENAVKHGVAHKAGQKGSIGIGMYREAGNLVCTITDNGLGREATKALKANNHSGHQSKGMGITEERIALLNRNQGAGITYDVTDIINENGKVGGTKIQIVFPLNFVENNPIS